MQATYHNPVYNANFPDPFVLKYCGEYWAYCTGTWPDGRWFGVLRSRDLARWEELGGAMEPLPGHWPCQWAPEVNYADGRFYLYYSLGDEATMQIRVAVSDHPAGPFVDSGRRLTTEPFAIDAHVFVDDDGRRHLFYATDYLDHSHVGTGTARLPLADPLTVAGPPVPVTRPRYDWQVYDPARAEKGGVRWHTVEGPFVLKRKGRYYQMFSGGNWQNPSYGVSYGITERIDAAGEWEQTADGVRVLPILRTLPGAVVGPGHNSAVRGPDNRQLYCVYHRWAADGSGRVMAIDPLDWAGERMLLLGPSTEPRPLALPSLADQFDGDRRLGPIWDCAGGSWAAGGGEAAQPLAAVARATCRHPARSYLVEVSLRALAEGAGGRYGLLIGERARFLLDPAGRRALAGLRGAQGWEERAIALPASFAFAAFHLLRVELNAGALLITLDEAAARWEARLPADEALPIALCTEGAPAAFAGFALTEGWEDRFERPGDDPATWGWAPPAWGGEGAGGWAIEAGALRGSDPAGPSALVKGGLPAAYELIVNLALSERYGPEGGWRIYPAARPDEPGPLLALAGGPGAWALRCLAGPATLQIALPPDFDAGRPQQLRIAVAAGRLSIAWEGRHLGDLPLAAPPTQVGLGVDRAGAAFEAVRLTPAPSSSEPGAPCNDQP